MTRGAEGESHPGAWSVLRRFATYARAHAGLLTGSSLAMFAEVGLRLLEPWPLKFVFDALLAEEGARVTGIGVLDDLRPGELVAWSGVLLVVVVGLGALAEYGRRVGFALAGNQILTSVRADLFEHIQRLSLTFHNRSRAGDLSTRLTSDIGRLQEVVSTAVLPLAVHVLTVASIAVVMVILEWRLALVAFAVLPLFWLSTTRLGREIRATARRERSRHGELGAIAAEALGSIHVVQSLGAEGEHGKHFKARNVSSLREGVRGKRLNAKLLGTADVFIALGSAVVLWYGATLALRGELSVGSLVLFLAYHKNMTRPIRNIAKYSGRTAKALASAERIVELFDEAPTIQESAGAGPAPERIGRLAFEGVRFSYRAGGVPAVDGVTLEARAGGVTALVGESGAGKSTLMSLLLRLYDPDEGRITADGVEISSFTVGSWRSRIAVVPQDNRLFAATVRENLAFGLGGRPPEGVLEEAARLAFAHEFISSLPEGYETELSEQGANLSEGQRQRLSIARAAARRAPIMIFDEPTASLDAEHASLIREAIRNLSRDRVCIVVTHDLRMIRGADRIVLLERGRVAEQGTHEELRALGGIYARFAAAQGVEREGVHA